MLVAREFSRGAVEWLTEREANWADETGRARIVGPGLVVLRDADRRPERFPRHFRWSASSRSIAELLLARPRPQLRVTELAGEARWSPGQVTTVLSDFDTAGWTRKLGARRGTGAWRALADADGLLSAWSTAVEQEPRPVRLGHRATRDAMTLLREALAPAPEATAWAVSGWAGADLAAPFTTVVPSLHVYVAEHDFAGPLSEAMQRAGLREVQEGARVVFWSTDARVLDLAEPATRLPVVSAPRLYADLLALGGRGEDAAEHVKSELIDPIHDRVRREGQALDRRPA